MTEGRPGGRSGLALLIVWFPMSRRFAANGWFVDVFELAT